MQRATNQVRPALIGGGLAVLTMALASVLPASRQHDLFAVLLAGIGAVYVGFAIAGGTDGLLALEAAGALVFSGVALAGLWFHASVLAAGYAAHGVWDVAHPHPVRTKTPGWYPPLCLTYDWAVAAYVFIAL